MKYYITEEKFILWEDNMVWLFRIIIIFACLNLANIIIVDGGAGMEPVWIAIIIMSFLFSFKKICHFFFKRAWFKWLFIICISFFVLVEGCIIVNGLGVNVPKNSDYLIVLGARVRGETLSLSLKARLDVACEYLKENPETKAVLSGGQGEGEDISEAEAMRRYLVEQGIDEERLYLENQSRDTTENLKYSFEIIDGEKEDASVIVVTNRFHVLRSKMIAKDLGKEVSGIGARTLQFLIPTYYLREFFAVVAEAIF